MIASSTYFRAQRRNLRPRQKPNDWLATVAEIDAMPGKGLNVTNAASP